MKNPSIKPRYVKPKPKRKPTKSEKAFKKIFTVIAVLILLTGTVVALWHLVNNHVKR